MLLAVSYQSVRVEQSGGAKPLYNAFLILPEGGLRREADHDSQHQRGRVQGSDDKVNHKVKR